MLNVVYSTDDGPQDTMITFIATAPEKVRKHLVAGLGYMKEVASHHNYQENHLKRNTECYCRRVAVTAFVWLRMLDRNDDIRHNSEATEIRLPRGIFKTFRKDKINKIMKA